MGLFHDDFHLSHSLLQPPTTLLCGLVILAAAAVAALLAPRRHIVSFGLIWFFWGQILESTTLPLALVFEHRNYLPGYGLLLCLGVAAWQGAGLLRRLPALRYGLLGLLLMIPAWQLHQRVSAWSSESAFLVHALNAHPDSSQVLVFAAVYLGNRGDFPAAMKALRRAEELDPGEFAYPWQELALRCHFAPDERIPARLGGRLRHSTAAKPWSPTAKVTFVRAVNACRRTKANDTLLMQLYRSLQPRGGGFFGMYSLLGEANVYWHRHDTRSALAAWEKAVARYPATGRLQPMLQKLKTALQRAGEIPP